MLPLAVQSTGLRKEMVKNKKVTMKDLTLHTTQLHYETIREGWYLFVRFRDRIRVGKNLKNDEKNANN